MKYNGLYYEINGEGTPILFLHGIGGSHRMFAPQVEVLRHYAKTICIDLKGHGQSENSDSRHYLDEHCRAIHELMNHLGIQKAIFVGLSYGGIVTQHFALQYPEKVSQMVLMDTYGHIFPRTVSQVGLLLFGCFIAASTLLPYRWLTPLFKQYEEWELAYEAMKETYKKRRRIPMAMQLFEVVGKSYLKELQTLHIPTLVMVGGMYPAVVEKSLEIYEHLPNAEFCLIEQAMDPTNLCDPDAVNEAILAFLSFESSQLAQRQ